MHINDRILEIVRENNNTDLSNVNLATLCLYEVLNSPLFNNNFKNINIIQRDKTFEIVKVKTSEQGLNSISSEFCSALPEDYFTNEDWQKKLEKELEAKLKREVSKEHSEDDDDYELYDDYDYEESIKKLYIQKEIDLSLNRLKEIMNSNNNYQDVIEEVIKELKTDPLFLIKVSALQEENLFLKTLKCFLSLPENMIKDQRYDINIYFNESKNEIEKKINADSFYLRDELGAMFLSEIKNTKSTQERLEKIVKSDYDFFEFLRLFSEDKHNIKRNATIEEKKIVIKEIIKKNKFAKEYFNKDFDYLFTKIFERKWDQIKEKILKQLNKSNYETIESLVNEKYHNPIKNILDKVYKDYPFLLTSKINPEEIKFEIIGVNVSKENNRLSGDKQYLIKRPFEIENYFKNSKQLISLLDIKDPRPEDLNRYESLNDKRNSLLLESFFKTNFSINSNHVSQFEGFKLFKKHDNHFYPSENLFLIRMTYNDMLIGLTKLSKVKDYLYKVETTEIAKPFRGNGLGYKIYDFIAEFINNNNLILYSDHYTTSGRKAIPDIKKKLSEKYHNFHYIENDYHPNSIEDLIHSSNLLTVIFPKYGSMMNILPYEKVMKINQELLKNKDKIIKIIEDGVMNNELSQYDIPRKIEEISLGIIKEMDHKEEKKVKVKRPKV